MRKQLLLCVVGLGTLLGSMTACSSGSGGDGNDGGNNPGPNESPTASTVSGKAVDTQGRPISRAKVWVQSTLNEAVSETHTQADGTYKVTGLSNTTYRVMAWTEVDYEGKRYCLRLGMPNASDYDVFSGREGAVRDFRWQLSGPIPSQPQIPRTHASFGGDVRFLGEGDFTGKTMEVTFTPTGPLIDGSTGSVVTRTVDINTDDVAYDIPIGKYTVTGVLVDGDERKPLRIGTTYQFSAEDQTESASFVFAPMSGCGPTTGVERGVLFANIP